MESPRQQTAAAPTKLAAFAFEPSGVLVRVSGELDLNTAPALREALNQPVDKGVARVVVDLLDVGFIDSISLAAIVHVSRRLEPGRLAIVVARNSYTNLVIEAAGMRDHLACVATLDQALGLVRRCVDDTSSWPD
jgi:anti-sigma B factor antagonist